MANATKEREAPQLDDREHAIGCPAERIEQYGREKTDGTQVVVVRCMDCGGQQIKEA